MRGEERNVTVVTLYAATEVTQSLRPQDLTNIFKQFISAKPLIDHSGRDSLDHFGRVKNELLGRFSFLEANPLAVWKTILPLKIVCEFHYTFA